MKKKKSIYTCFFITADVRRPVVLHNNNPNKIKQWGKKTIIASVTCRQRFGMCVIPKFHAIYLL